MIQILRLWVGTHKRLKSQRHMTATSGCDANTVKPRSRPQDNLTIKYPKIRPGSFYLGRLAGAPKGVLLGGGGGAYFWRCALYFVGGGLHASKATRTLCLCGQWKHGRTTCDKSYLEVTWYMSKISHFVLLCFLKMPRWIHICILCLFYPVIL